MLRRELFISLWEQWSRPAAELAANELGICIVYMSTSQVMHAYHIHKRKQKANERDRKRERKKRERREHYRKGDKRSERGRDFGIIRCFEECRKARPVSTRWINGFRAPFTRCVTDVRRVAIAHRSLGCSRLKWFRLHQYATGIFRHSFLSEFSLCHGLRLRQRQMIRWKLHREKQKFLLK